MAAGAEGPAEDEAGEHTEGRAGQWLTVTQAARHLGISERAVPKKVATHGRGTDSR